MQNLIFNKKYKGYVFVNNKSDIQHFILKPICFSNLEVSDVNLKGLNIVLKIDGTINSNFHLNELLYELNQLNNVVPKDKNTSSIELTFEYKGSFKKSWEILIWHDNIDDYEFSSVVECEIKATLCRLNPVET